MGHGGNEWDLILTLRPVPAGRKALCCQGGGAEHPLEEEKGRAACRSASRQAELSSIKGHGLKVVDLSFLLEIRNNNDLKGIAS